MAKNIQMIFTGEAILFILGFDVDKQELTFRTSRNPEYIQTEKILVQDNFVYTNLYFFHISYLKKFLTSIK